MITFKEYQDYVKSGVNLHSMSDILCAIGLAEEAGEVAGVFKRRLRNLPGDAVKGSREHLIEECGDVLWYLTAILIHEGVSLEDVANANKEKLDERYNQ